MKSRNTQQKEIIQAEIDKQTTFFTAQDLDSSIKKHNPTIGLATTYRHLKELREQGRIHSYLCNGKLIYSTQKRSHCHYICENTGKTIHFDVDSLDFLANKIPGNITSFQLEVKGTCKDCKKKE